MEIYTDLTYASPEHPILKQKLIRSIENLSGKKKIERLYEMIPDCHAGKASFFCEAFKVLRVQLNYDPAQLEKIPVGGPLVFIANHPFGVLDGMFLCYLGAISRPNWGTLVYSKFCEIDHFNSNLLPIAFEETEQAVKLNIDTKNRAIELLRNDGAVIIFPAGSISKAKGFRRSISDIEWKLFAAKIIQMTQATVVPVFFHGNNSWVFHTVSHFSETLRLALIISELRNKIGKSIRVTIGDPLPYEELSGIKKRQALLNHLRNHTYRLARQAKY
jgi:putative hemolysin